jgi:hypothetical protein
MKLGKVVETSFFHINIKHGRTGCGSRPSFQSSPISGLSCKAHTDPNSRLTEECMYRMTKEYADAKL